jgi:hypothetical protein
MLKLLLRIFLFSFIPFTVYPQEMNRSPQLPSDYTARSEDLKEKVKVVRTFIIHGDDSLHQFMKCREISQLERTVYMMEDKYDSSRKIIESRQLEKGGKMHTWNYYYNKAGKEERVLRQTWMLQDNAYWSSGRVEDRYKYDRKNNLVKETMWISNGMVFHKWYKNSYHKYRYDSRNRLIMQAVWARDSRHEMSLKELLFGINLVWKDNYKINENDSTVESRRESRRGKYEKKEKYSYNSRGQITAKYEITDTVVRLVKSWTYNDKGQLLDDGYYFYTYNEKGLLTEVRMLHSGRGQLPAYYLFYDNFDSKGNWQKRTNTSQSPKTVITIREIEYY